MSTETWANMPKSQDDDETIEEAIARIVAEHNADETAHLGVGQSLQSHAASDVIDHLAKSIISDKIADFQITPRQFNQDLQYFAPQFENIDIYNKIAEGAGAGVHLQGFGILALVPGSAVGNRAILSADNGFVSLSADKDPFFQVIVSDSGDEVSDIGASMSMDSPFNAARGGFGIEWIRSSNICRGFYNTYYSGGWHRQVVTLKTGAPYNEIWRAEFDYNLKKIRFYIDGVLISTMDVSTHFYNFDDDFYLALGAIKKTSYADSAVFFMNAIFGQNLN
jgi:hypothetical protein